MAPKTATDYKTEGNEHFKAGRHGQASMLFAKAESLDPTDPVYPSNLSAALYENGQYADAIRAILRSWLLLKPLAQDKPDLVTRLFTRLGKALAQGIASGQVDAAFLKEQQLGMESLKHAVVKLALEKPEDAALVESVRAWPDLLDLNAQVDGREEVVKAGLKRFSKIAIIKEASMGMDNVISLLRGWEGYEEPLPLKSLSKERLSNLSFLFGGVGDGRHVYTTVVDVHHQWKKLPQEKKDATFVHITMNDIHPAMLARDIVIMSLASQISDEGLEPIDRLEIKAAVVYLWNGVAMPSYCAERVRNVMQDLRDRFTESPPRLPKWLAIGPESLPAIIQHIMLWLTVRPKSVGPVLDNHVYRSMEAKMWEQVNNPMIPPAIKSMSVMRMNERKKEIAAMLKSWSIDDYKEIGLIDRDASNAQAKREIKMCLEPWTEAILDIMVKGGIEDVWYSELKVYLPPPELRSRHPGFEELAKATYPGKTYDPDQIRKAEKHIRATFETNRTFYAIDPVTKHAESGYGEGEETYLSMSSLKTIRDFLATIVPGNYRDQELFSQALQDMKGHIRIEALTGDLNGELAKMWLGDDTRPADYPRKFTRGWLSNVPDYTGGILNTAIYIVPQTDGSPESGIASNTFAATGFYRNLPDYDNQFCHTFSLLPFRDLPRYLGCKAVGQKAVFKALVLSALPLPRPIHELASRTELTTWLTRTLLNILIPGRSKEAPDYIRLPTNLAGFVGLLVHLHRVGFPGHWLADYLQTILSGSIITDIAPFEGEWPILLSDMKRRVSPRKIRLDPWLADFENILAVCHEALPFSVTLPPDFAKSPDEIGTYSCTMTMSNPFFVNNLHPRDPGMTLAFSKKHPASEGYMMTRLNKILTNEPWEKYKHPAPGTIFVLTAVDAFDRDGEVRFKMSKKRMAEMKEGDNWTVVAPRSSVMNNLETRPVPCARWREV
ncbi:hypothetical protein EIP91_008282 [Steccherinum ochraceum]|uniref:DUF4470 domain-containing protein n=1 Tax=Steccherinum ochraceum TaxID=92696 RepID=A0A4R0RD62_9APHY|nr:hypothetical protein EIP91_008282 [Steccherinum ochraceum]